MRAQEMDSLDLKNSGAKLLTLVLLLALALLTSGCRFGKGDTRGYVGGPGGGSSPGQRALVALKPTTSNIVLPEGAQVDLIIELDRPMPKDGELNWLVENGSADFEKSSGVSPVEQGEDQVRIPLKALNDGIYEGDEEFKIKVFGDPSLFSAAVEVTAKVTDSSPVPVAAFSASSQTVGEETGDHNIEVVLSEPSVFITTLRLETSGSAQGAGADYFLSPSAEVSFLPGETSKNLQIKLIDNSVTDPLRDAVITLAEVTYGVATVDASHQSHTVWIVDDESASVEYSITGVTGGDDAKVDFYFTELEDPTIHWQSAPDALSYQVEVRDGGAVVCPMSPPVTDTKYTFTGCTLADGQSYQIYLEADVGGTPTPAQNNLMAFTVDATPPGEFIVIGLTGGYDISPDKYLAGGLEPVVHWTDSPDEHEYFVTIFNDDQTTVKCPEVRVAANQQAYSFSGCQLVLETDYYARVVARDEAGNVAEAKNSPFQFTVTTVPSGFIIRGVTGGTADVDPDDQMTDGEDVILNWDNASGEVGYEVTIFENNETTEKCPTISVAADQTSAVFTNCPLDLHTLYKAVVVAYDSNGNAYPAANSPFQFRHKVGLYVSGTGGSYYRGIAITSCGGAVGDVCDSTTPYVAQNRIEEDQIRIGNNGVITGRAWVAGAPTVTNGVLEISAKKLWVDPGSTVTMTGKGYTSGNGPGAAPMVTQNFEGGSGGAYGGYSGFTSSVKAAPYGSILDPADLGSPGGSNSYNQCGTAEGGSGGGLVSLNAEVLYLNGSVESNGAPGFLRNCNSSHRTTSGGGSGGTVRIDAQILRGSSGLLRVNGGNGASTTSGNVSESGAGSGGRIWIGYDTDEFVGTVDTMTLQSYGGTLANSRAGAAGSILLVNRAIGKNRLIVDNGPNLHLQGIETPGPIGEAVDSWETRNNGTMIIGDSESLELYSDTISYRIVAEGDFTLPAGANDLKIASGGYLEWRKKDPLALDSLEIQPGGVLTHSFNNDSLDYALDVRVSNMVLLGNIDVSGRGYRRGEGPGSGALSAGGAHGGMGGHGSGENSKSPYGDIKAPVELGSGGSGAEGGGVVLITVTGDFLLMGNIFANGDSASSGGGGSGGTINISAGRIYGTGSSLRANGGDGSTNSGGGSGGRIALVYADDDYLPAGAMALNYQAFGGMGSFRDGAAGTVYVRDEDDVSMPNGHLIVRNSVRSYNEDTTTVLLGAEDFDSITSDTTGTLHVPAGMTLALPSQTINYRMVMEGDFTLPGGDDLILGSGGYLEWRKSSALKLDSLTIQSGGVLTHSHNGATFDYRIDIDVDDLTLHGEITATGRGYTAGNGPGASPNMNTSGAGAAGASYGGRGGWGTSAPGVDAYGDLKSPSDLGSGGGSNGSATGGQGGGLIHINVANTFSHFGAIRANGSSGLNVSSGTSQRTGGGGSGGGILINVSAAGTIQGIGGIVEAIGGNSSGIGGSGAGGRIAIHYGNDNYTGGVGNLVLRSSGGTISTSRSGAAGTIYFKDLNAPGDGLLIVDNDNLRHNQGVETTLPIGIALDNYSTRNNGTFILEAGDNFELQSDVIDYRVVIEGDHTLPGGSTQMTIASGGMLEWRRDTKIVLDTLTVAAGGLLTHSYNASTQEYFLDMDVDTLNLYGTIDVDHRGFAPGQGPGKSTNSAGGSYGGQGGAAGSYSFAPPTYGDPIHPSDLGSGSGGGRGGGMVLIDALTANINGLISARGQSFTGCTAGGSGGTIRLYAETITGATGLFRVPGGSSCTLTAGGGGGRIAIHYKTDNFGAGGLQELTLEAQGGAGEFYGAAGTIYLRQDGVDNHGRLIVKNGPSPKSEWTTTTLPDNGEFDSIETDAGTSLEIKAGETFALPTATIDYRLVVGGDFTLPSGGQDLVVASGGSLEMRRKDPLVLNSLTIATGATLSHSSNFANEDHILHIKVDDLILNGNINVNSKGFEAGKGPGSMSNYNSGAAHAGFGGWGSSTATSRGMPYGDARNPTELGSGGGTSSTSTLGRGGGLVIVEADNFTLNGTITANGGGGGSSGTGNSATGGSGGSVNIAVDVLTGNTGAIYARGGSSSTSGYGSGSGGRIALVYNTENYIGGLSQLIMDARGGTTNDATTVGAAGTIYLSNGITDKLIVNNFTNPFRRYVNTALLDDYTYDEYEIGPRSGIFVPSARTINLWTDTLDFPLEIEGVVNWPNDVTMTSTAYLDWARSIDPLSPEPLEFNSLTMQSGATITHAPNAAAMQYFIDLDIDGDFVMYPGSRIEVSSMGHAPGAGVGTSNTGGSGTSPSGASYGGEGGEGLGTMLPEAPYGVANDPQHLGSGGSSNGSAGGGYVRLNIGGNFHFEGEIYANGGTISGNTTLARGRGAGSGGGVKITTNSLSGSMGIIEARGGSTLPDSLVDDTGGSGGGGRVALTYTTNNYVGPLGSPNGLNISVEPGDSRPDRIGQPGSLVITP